MTPHHPHDGKALLRVDRLGKTYGQGDNAVEVLRDVTLRVGQGELVSIVGPSGAGKTTLLNALSGLSSATAGSITFDGSPVQGPPEGMSMVFQDYSRSLMPWMSVYANVELPLRRAVRDRRRRRELAQAALAGVGLPAAGELKPYQLSGGMQQRVAIARALVGEPSLLIMDEPFASVDAQTREELEDLTRNLPQRFHVSIVLVTHDIDEAVYLSDRIVVLAGKPTTVHDEIDVSLGAERDQVETKLLEEFGNLRGRVHAGIRGERWIDHAPRT
jgi:NitT/TauT family transport system ATP-binding protein